jgi:hypothetical protein
MILGLTLADLDQSSQDLDNITITLTCGHTFTVETLDGICELTKAYKWNDQTQTWGQPLLPQEVFLKTPSCPTCRSPIDARRYGRITKRSNLDLLERNVATRMARDLERLHRSLQVVNWNSLEERVSNIANPRSYFGLPQDKSQAMERNRNKILILTDISNVIPISILGPQLEKMFGIPKQDAIAWKKIIKPIMRTCGAVEELSGRRTAHSAAYQASFSMLFDQEYRLALTGSGRPKNPDLYAFQVAKTKIGMAHPRADTRFQVEAIWLTLETRFRIGTLAERYYSKLAESKDIVPAHLETWRTVVEFIYKSCDRDARLALQIATRSVAHRQVLLSNLQIYRARWRSLQFLVVSKQLKKNGLDPDERKDLAQRVGQSLLVTKREARQALKEGRTKGNLAADIVEKEFDGPLSQLLKSWEDLVSTLNRPSVFYQKVTEEEMRSVVASFTAEYSKFCPRLIMSY